MKTVAMIPVRMGSTRVPKKNIRLLAGKPLVAWIIEAAKRANCFDEIYLNSEDDLFKEIADQYGIKFYKRPPAMAADSASNDDFMNDFLQNVQCDTVIQLLATSPFLHPFTIQAFTEQMKRDSFDTLMSAYDTLVSVKNVQIECLYKNTELNFFTVQHTQPSQTLEPVQAYACGIMGWNAAIFKQAYAEKAGAYHGMNKGKWGTYVISGCEVIDIDSEDDFILAEAIAATMGVEKPTPRYYESATGISGNTATIEGNTETNVDSILSKDGVQFNDLDGGNNLRVTISEIVLNMFQVSGGQSWSHRIINTPQGSATLICQYKGQSNREHYHPDISEWWYIVTGEYNFKVDGKANLAAKAGDIVFIDKGRHHLITATGSGANIRLAVSIDGAKHVYTDNQKI